MTRPPKAFARLPLLSLAVLHALALTACNADGESFGDGPMLAGRAVLPAGTLAAGPTSGQYLSGDLNGQAAPFAGQPVQGFSAALRNADGSYLAMADNGYGAIENSADFNLRVYTVRSRPVTSGGGDGSVAVEGFIELRDPDRKIPFAIVNQFSAGRVLTGADFDIESMQRAPDGSLWFGDEFGPFLLHTDAQGVLLEAPIALPDFENPGREIRSPQSPYNEEASALRIMNAARAHAQAHGGRTPVFSPYSVMLKYDANGVKSSPDAHYARGANTPAGLAPAVSDVFDLASLKSAGFPVVAWTVNDKPKMLELMKAGVNGLISDRSDLLLEAVREFDANRDGQPGDYLDADGLIDARKFDAQGHRGSRDLRPENTLPAFEAALDNLMTTIETDTGLSRDGVPIVKHDPYIETQKCRRADGQPYDQPAQEVLIKDLTRAEIQAAYICDKLFRGPSQRNDPALSPVSVAVATGNGYVSPYVLPTAQDLFDLVAAYVAYYETGAGRSHPAAALRARNARRVRFNIETKLNPRSDADNHGKAYRERTAGFEQIADALAGVIVANGMQARADIQSFDFRTLFRVQEKFPAIRTAYLFGDFPIFAGAGSDDGTNLQDEAGRNTAWLNGLYWPYRSTVATTPFRAKRSGGFEGMALSSDGKKLYPLLEGTLAGHDDKTLLIHEFDLASRRYTGKAFKYRLDARGSNIGDFVLYNATEGIVIERDNSQGDLKGFKKLFKVELGQAGGYVGKSELVDLMAIRDPFGLSGKGGNSDVGLGSTFAMPFNTIEDVVVLDAQTLLVIDDNNYPFSVGRHVGGKRPDDSEFVTIRLPRALRLDR